MPIPPKKKPVHIDSIQTSLRLPRKLHAEMQAKATREARTLNAEILIRLQASTDNEAARRHEEVMSMLQRILSK